MKPNKPKTAQPYWQLTYEVSFLTQHPLQPMAVEIQKGVTTTKYALSDGMSQGVFAILDEDKIEVWQTFSDTLVRCRVIDKVLVTPPGIQGPVPDEPDVSEI